MVTRGGMFSDPIDEAGARALFERAAADAASELSGDLVGGFVYWVVREGLKLVRVRVRPVAA